MNLKKLFFSFIIYLVAFPLNAQVLGSCGDEAQAGKTVYVEVTQETVVTPQVQPLLLPGQQAIDFELPAVVGNQIKNVKLSDYAGKWIVLCFYPGDFTFV